MTFEELRSQLRGHGKAFAGSVRDAFGQSIEQDVFDVCDNALAALQETSDQAETEKRVIDAMLLELRLIIV